MRIIALLPHDSTQALQRCMGASDTLMRASGPLALTRMISARTADAVVIDPTEVGVVEWSRVRLVLQSARIPVLVYTSLGPVSVQRVLSASAIGSYEVLFRHIDDDAAAMRRRLETLGTPAPPSRLLSMLAGRIERLPVVLQRETVPLFCAGPVPRWADVLARHAEVPRRSVDRWMQRAGLAGTAALLDAARLARVWVPLVEGHNAQVHVALHGGYRRVAMLSGHARRIVGVSPAHFGKKLTVNEFVDRLAAHVLRD